MKFLLISLAIIIFFQSTLLSEDYEAFLDENINQILVIRLKNGDMITGLVEDIYANKTERPSFKVKTAIGTTEIYFDEVNDIQLKDDLNRHSHRAFIMPTAEPIGDNHFLSNYMIALFYGGFGISDFLSVTLGTTLIPTVESRHQISVLNAKATVYNTEWEEMKGGLSIAVGWNLAFINHDNRFTHLYTNFTFRGDRTDLTAMVFVKTGKEDFYEIRFADRMYPSLYLNNAYGIGLGLTTKFSERHDIYFVGELWNTDISQLTNTGILGAMRIQNSTFSADFGLMFFTSPALFPVINFAWTPF